MKASTASYCITRVGSGTYGAGFDFLTNIHDAIDDHEPDGCRLCALKVMTVEELQ